MPNPLSHTSQGSISYSYCFSSFFPLIIIFLFFGFSHTLFFLLLFYISIFILCSFVIDFAVGVTVFFFLFCFVFLLVLVLFCVLFCSVSTCVQDGVDVVPLSQPAGGVIPPMGQQQSRPKYNRRTHITHTRDVPRASSSGDQRDCTSGSHRTPPTQDHLTRTGSQGRSI